MLHQWGSTILTSGQRQAATSQQHPPSPLTFPPADVLGYGACRKADLSLFCSSVKKRLPVYLSTRSPQRIPVQTQARQGRAQAPKLLPGAACSCCGCTTCLGTCSTLDGHCWPRYVDPALLTGVSTYAELALQGRIHVVPVLLRPPGLPHSYDSQL